MPTVRVFIVVHRWHSGVALPRAALAPAILPEVADFPDADYLEFGWGDRDYYEGKRGAWVILKAALWPRPGVLHVASCSGKIVRCFPYSRILSLDLTDAALQRLSERLGGSFRRDAQPKAPPLGPGLYGESRFYPSRDKFHVLRTCNTWTASLLQAAGYPLRPASSLTVNSLLKQLKPYGTLLQANHARVGVHAPVMQGAAIRRSDSGLSLRGLLYALAAMPANLSPEYKKAEQAFRMTREPRASSA